MYIVINDVSNINIFNGGSLVDNQEKKLIDKSNFSTSFWKIVLKIASKSIWSPFRIAPSSLQSRLELDWILRQSNCHRDHQTPVIVIPDTFHPKLKSIQEPTILLSRVM
jgi:hypothetical protein